MYAAATAKSLQSCPTLCDPRHGSPPGSAIPGILQEADQVVWYSHLLKNFPLFIVIHTVKGFGLVNKAEVDVFLELSCFFYDPVDVSNLISGSSAFSNSILDI